MVFGEPSSSSYGTHSSSSAHSHGRQEASQQPLRSRPHTRGTSGSPSDLLFSHPHSSFDEFPYPPYSELPFTSLRRRKQGNQFVKWAMRAVLASPVIVLVFWSIGAMIFSKNVSHRSRHSTMNRISTRASMRRLPDNVGQLSQPLLQPFMITPQNQMYGIPQNNMPQPAYMIPPQQLEQQQQQQTPQVPMAQQQQQLQMQLQWPQAYGMVQQQPMGEASANLVMPQFYTNGNSIATNPSMGQQESPSLQQPLRPRQESLGVQPDALPMNNIQPPVQQQQLTNTMPPPKEAEPAVFVMQEQPMGAAPISNGNPRPSLNNNPMPRADVTVLYYDPKQTIAGPNGQVRLPTIVYDAQGNPVDLVSLVAQNQAQILLEPPMRQAEEAPARLLVQEQEMPAAQLATPDIKRWGESTAQDQSIIVSTVAVMALLVGALSARRMRNRSVLSSCIENESLEDDVAYDAAYSTTLPQTEGSSYNTFGGGWKGDLEKFDV